VRRAVRVCRGSTTTRPALRPRPFRSYRAMFRCAIDAGWFSAGFAPMTRNIIELSRSDQLLVIAPRPNVRPRPATVDECHMRAWCSTRLVPKFAMILRYR